VYKSLNKDKVARLELMPENRILRRAQELHARLDDPIWVPVDCRFNLGDPLAGRQAFEAAHIPGAVFLDLDEDLAGPVTEDSGRHPLPDPDALAVKLGNLGIGNSQRVVVYDAGPGAIAARAWWVLRWLGHDAVYLLDGGLGYWESLGFPVTAEVERRPVVTFEARCRDERVLSTAELAANAKESIDRYKLLDARDASRFRGEVEPIDTVAGHIPGSVNRPFSDFVREDGTWLPLEERTVLLEEAIGSDRETDWGVMCGSGVTACHLAITGREAGFREPRLYVGSWSEWIRDPQRPRGTSDA
jgi:thiosulfate/3-mercaptopyruvate sulfurtransferase